jgi:undecaprenyl-diphosphatase
MSEELIALILGAIQGFTEFLPVSSSGHLEFGKILFDKCNSVAEDDLLFSVVVHLATAFATLIVFRKDVAQIFKGLFQFKNNEESRFSLFIVVSMIPAAVIGLFFKDEITDAFACNPFGVGGALIFTAIILFVSEKLNWKKGELNTFKSIIVGIAQAIALIPGVSRSGSTIGASLMLGIDKEKAARFSFLMVLPLIFGLAGKELMEYFEMVEMGQKTQFSGTSLVIGFASAFVTGWFACKWMIKIVKRSGLIYFAVYCLIAGILGIILS